MQWNTVRKARYKMLIRAYGQFWNPEVVHWGKRGQGNNGKLIGKITKSRSGKTRKHNIDFWHAEGIYVLHENFRPVYVGKAVKTHLGPRLRNHLTDRFAGRWDMFSWFSQSDPNITKGDVRPSGIKQVGPNEVTSTLEALSILIADPPLNRKRESIPSALQAEQVAQPNPRGIINYLADILSKVEKLEEKDG